MQALEGRIRVEARASSRDIPVEEFFTGELQTSLTSKELLVEARFPVVPPRTGVAFSEVNRRHGCRAASARATPASCLALWICAGKSVPVARCASAT